MKFTEYIGSQFGNPRGIIGGFCCVLMNVINRAQYKGVLDHLQCSSKSKVLDIGFGNGHLIWKIYAKYHCFLYGIDISADMVRVATERNKNGVHEGKILLQTGDCLALPYDSNWFDQVVSINTIYFWGNIEKGLSEILRVLKPGKSFVNAVYSREFLTGLSYTRKGFTILEPEELKTAALNVGFSSAVSRPLKNGKSYIIICTK